MASAGGPGSQRFFGLGDCPLENGEIIRGCRIGYRTFGALNASRSNLVLFSTWFTGTSEELTEVVPDKLVDTKQYFVVLVDSLGDGLSSSPSNSPTQGRLAFPRFTIRDMVETQRRLLREHFGVERPHAVMGISMGGMQAFQWASSHGVDRAVSIVGTPQLTSHDLLLWNAQLHALDDSATYAKGNYVGRPRISAVLDVHWMMLHTPSHRAAETSRAAFPEWSKEIERDTSFDWNDRHRQLEAMLVHDVARDDGGLLEVTARKTTAKMLIVVADQDQMVHPGPSKAFAAAAPNATLVSLPGACGHAEPSCSADELRAKVRAFLESP